MTQTATMFDLSNAATAGAFSAALALAIVIVTVTTQAIIKAKR